MCCNGIKAEANSKALDTVRSLDGLDIDLNLGSYKFKFKANENIWMSKILI